MPDDMLRSSLGDSLLRNTMLDDLLRNSLQNALLKNTPLNDLLRNPLRNLLLRMNLPPPLCSLPSVSCSLNFRSFLVAHLLVEPAGDQLAVQLQLGHAQHVDPHPQLRHCGIKNQLIAGATVPPVPPKRSRLLQYRRPLPTEHRHAPILRRERIVLRAGLLGGGGGGGIVGSVAV